jgi:hypothetical protein
MSASSEPKTSPTTLVMFTAWCRARAALYAAGEIPNFQNAVDALREHAERHGLIAKHGQGAVQRIISEAFGPVWAGEAS